MSHDNLDVIRLHERSAAPAAVCATFLEATAGDLEMAADYLFICGYPVSTPSRHQRSQTPQQDQQRSEWNVTRISPSPSGDHVSRARERCKENIGATFHVLQGMASTIGFPSRHDLEGMTEKVGVLDLLMSGQFACADLDTIAGEASLHAEFRFDICVPEFSDAGDAAVLASWSKVAGDSVIEGEVVALIETVKAVLEVQAPATGTMLNPVVDVGADINEGQVLAQILCVGAELEVIDGANTLNFDGRFDVCVPELLGAGPVAKLASWSKVAGDSVVEGEVVALIETGKVVLDVQAPATGTMLNPVVDVGTDIVEGQVLAQILSVSAGVECMKDNSLPFPGGSGVCKSADAAGSSGNDLDILYAITGKATYEASVIGRAIGRAGQNRQLKGHIHEVLLQDQLRALNLTTGSQVALTKSTTAPVVDIVIKRGGKVVERIQVKDVISPSAVRKLVKQVGDGKYRSAKLVGTDETTRLVNEALERAGLTKRMVSSGVSTKYTEALAQRGGASGSGSLRSAVGNSAHAGGVAGAAIGAGVELVSGVSDLIDGSRDASDVAASVAKAGAKGYATGFAASGAATAGGAFVASGLGAVGAGAGLTAVAAVAAPIAIAAGAGYLVSELWDAVFD